MRFPVATAKVKSADEDTFEEEGEDTEFKEVDEDTEVATPRMRSQGTSGLETGTVRLLTAATKTSAGGPNATSARHPSLKVRLNLTVIFFIFCDPIVF